MKPISICKSVLSATLLIVTIVGCGSGDKNTSQNSSSNNQSFDQGTSTIETMNFNLYNSIFLSPNKTYTYHFIDNNGNSIYDSKGNDIGTGTLVCNTTNDCLIKSIPMNTNYSYTLSIYNSSNNTFVGGAQVKASVGNSYTNLSIDDMSTSAYIQSLVTNQLANQFDFGTVELQIFEQVMNYFPDKSVPSLLYTYYTYLINNGKSSDQAIQSIISTFKQCETGQSCALDSNFTTNSAVVQTAIDSMNTAIQNYINDKNDTLVHQNYDDLKNALSSVVSLGNTLSTIKDPINAIFNGAGNKIVQGTSVLNSLINTFFGSSSTDSKAAFDRMQAFNQNINTLVLAATPNYQAIQTQLTSTMNASTIASTYNTYISDISLDFLTVVNDFASSESVIQYISENSEKIANFNGLINGTFNSLTVEKRRDAITYFTTVENAVALATAYQQIFQVAPQSNVNNIATRRAYNQTLALLMQNILTALQQSMYLDQLAITIRDTTIKSSLSTLKNFEIVAAIGLSPFNSPDLNADLQALNSYYLDQANSIQNAFLQLVLPEKGNVPQNVLQSVEVEGGCNITATDGLDTLTASCPVFHIGNVATYTSSTLSSSKTNCLTVNNDAGGGIESIGEVRNFHGILVCKSKADYSNSSADPAGSTDGSLYLLNDNPNTGVFVNSPAKAYLSGNGFDDKGDYSTSDSIWTGTVNVPIDDTNNFINQYSYRLEERNDGEKETDSINITSVEYKNSNYSEISSSFSYPWGNIFKIYPYYYATDDSETFAPSIQNINYWTAANNVSLIIPESAVVSEVEYRDIFGGSSNALYVNFTNGGQTYSRVLVPGGQYNIDSTSGKIVMTNSSDWETNSAIDPFISSAAASLGGQVHISGTTGGNVDLNCPNSTNISQMAASLIAQGRDEVADKITNGMNCSQSDTYNIYVTLPQTKLYIPFQANYSGYKSFTVWNSPNGYRADHYGDSTSNDPNNDHCPYVDTYNLSGNTYDGGHITTSNNGYWQAFCWGSTKTLDLRGWK